MSDGWVGERETRVRGLHSSEAQAGHRVLATR